MEEELTLGEIISIVKNHMGKIVTWGLVGLILTGVYTFLLVVPQYQSTSKIVVNQTQNSGQAITNTDIQTNLNLINTYQNIIQEPIILEDVIKSLNIDLTAEELRRKVSIQTQNNSLVFGITVKDDNPYLSAELANGIASSFEGKIGSILEVESVTILSEAVPVLNPVSPNVGLNLLLGITIGLLFGLVLGFISEMMNKTVKDDKIIEILGWTNLGSILEMSSDEVKDTRIKTDLTYRQSNEKKSRKRV